MARIIHHGVEIPMYPEPKDPQGTAVYGFDWSQWLDIVPGETILTSTWRVHPDLTVVAEDNDTTGTLASIAGGKRMREYTITNSVSSATRVEERSFRILVKNK